MEILTKPIPRLSVLLMGTCLIFFFSGSGNVSAMAKSKAEDFTKLSLEELMEVELTSAARKSQKLSETAAAAFVISAEDIRRSGAASIPEALRLVPGIHVARINSAQWAVSARGFNSRLANKLLVLMDGRSVYSPIFSGVIWDTQDTLMEDIERIEVICGPGASLWGANAVNGIINIITKHAKDTRGTLVSAGIGTEEISGGVRHGGRTENTDYRIYAKYVNRDESADARGSGTSDTFEMYRSGFRMDKESEISRDKIRVQGDIYTGISDQIQSLPSLNLGDYDLASGTYLRYQKTDISSQGFNLLGRWEHLLSENSSSVLQIYADHDKRDDAFGEFSQTSFDADFQHRITYNSETEIIWGAGYRLYMDNIPNNYWFSSESESKSTHLYSAFIQLEQALIPDRVRLTLGAKLEHNSYTDFEFQPNLRILWTPEKEHAIWTSVSRAIRTPSRYESDMRLLASVIPTDPMLMNAVPFPQTAIYFAGNHEAKSEELIAVELGYRVHPSERFSINIASFYNFYNNVSSGTISMPYPDINSASPHWTLLINSSNDLKANTYGTEISAAWHIFTPLKLTGAYTLFKTKFEAKESSTYAAIAKETDDPDHQFSFRASLNLPKHAELDLWFRYTDDILNNTVKAYSALDARLGWTLRENIEFSIVGRNLLDSHHPEFINTFNKSIDSEVQREIYGKILWKF